jgi:mannosyl-oligosaccharide alpha-1,2-mannosidase
MPVVPVVPETKAKPEDEPVRHIVLPERIPISPTKVYTEEEEEDEIHPVAPPGRQEVPILAAEPTTIHWAKQVEHFPIARESIIPLPTGATKQIPKIQYAFNDETPDAKINRQKRQDKVREEFQRAWNGYKTRAWLHDELSPVTGKFRDPFCGWAATLVDTLDTLWIMGLQEDFEEAAKAVNLIDFTTSPRPDIPVFETTIRYLGGLLAAYDVSGATYKNLLDKAVELAEVLMGIFDTPNRMPDLYYRWKPTFASQPHRASQRSSLAELGSLSMEFTRLAQITKDNRYYDAIARITDALSDWQDRGTMLDGVFPDNVDASGCNRTEVEYQQPHQSGREPAIFPAKQAEEPVGFQPTVVDPVLPVQKKDSKPASGVDTSATKNKLAKRAPLDVPTGNSTVSKAGADSKPRSDSSFSTDVKPPVNSKLLIDSRPAPKPATHPKQTGDSKPADANPPIESKTLVEAKQPANSRPPTDPITGLPLDIPAAQAAIGLGVGSWDCIPQGLEPASPHGHNKFSMGGGQDSTYEYFPKVTSFLFLPMSRR